MGTSDRDWYRESYEHGRPRIRIHMTPACKWILGLTLLVYLCQLTITRPASQTNLPNGEEWPKELVRQMQWQFRVSLVEQALELSPRAVARGQVWRLLTYALCHDRFSLFHILFNMLFLWWFGQRLERKYGTAEFLLFYLTAALLAGLAYMAFGYATKQLGPVIGASGAILAVLMVYAMLYPNEKILIMFLFPVRIIWVVLFYVAWDLHPILLAIGGHQLHDGVAHAAHLGGLGFGFLYWRKQWRLEPYWRRVEPYWQRIAVRLKRNRPRPAPPTDESGPEEPAPADIDRILDKIGSKGIQSLTRKERETLRKGYRVTEGGKRE